MAARTLKPRHQDEVRAKIQTSQLINRLENHALKDLDLKPSQIKAIEILLGKTFPNLQMTQLSGDPKSPLSVETSIAPEVSREEWLKAHGVKVSKQ